MNIDVVIPNYNRTNLLLRAVNSVISQQYINKVYIVDDGSNQETQKFYSHLTNLDSSIVILKNIHTGDPGKLRNLGIKNSKAEWIGFLDSDDYWELGRIRQILDYLKDSQINFYCSNAKKLHEGTRLLNDLYLSKQEGCTFELRDLLRDNFVITSTVITRRETLLDVGGFASGDQVKNCEDYATWLKIVTLGGTIFDPRPLVNYQYSSSSYSRDIKLNLDRKAFFDFIKWNWKSQVSLSKKLSTNYAVYRTIYLRVAREFRNTILKWEIQRKLNRT